MIKCTITFKPNSKLVKYKLKDSFRTNKITRIGKTAFSASRIINNVRELQTNDYLHIIFANMIYDNKILNVLNEKILNSISPLCLADIYKNTIKDFYYIDKKVYIQHTSLYTGKVVIFNNIYGNLDTFTLDLGKYIISLGTYQWNDK